MAIRVSTIIKGVVAILSLLIIAAAAMIALFDPNDYKEEIASAVETNTGRVLTLNDPLEWTFYPWLGVRTGNVTLGNREGFDEAHFLSAEQASLRVKLLPLLKGELVADTVLLDGAEFHFRINETGTDNWSDLLAEKAQDVSGPAGPALRNISINGTDIRNSVITFDNRVTDMRYRLDIRQAQTGIIDLESPIPLSLDMGLSGTGLPTSNILLKGTVAADLERQVYRIADLDLNLSPEKQATVALRGGIEVDLPTRTLRLNAFRLERGNSVASGELVLRGFEGIPSVSGTLELSEFVPATIAGLAGGPETDSPLMLAPVSGNLAFEGGENSMRIPAFDLSVDGEKLSGSLDASSLNPLHAEFRLEAGNIDLDKYSGSDQQESAAKTEDADNSNASPAGMKEMRLKGDVRVASVKSGGLQISNIAFGLDLDQNVLNLTHLNANALGIPVSGALAITDPAGAFSYEGNLQMATFNPRAVMRQLGTAMPDVSDSKVLSTASGGFNLTGTSKGLRLDTRAFQLDDSSISGAFELIDFANPAYALNLDINAIDLDRYLPPKSGAKSSGAAGEAHSALRDLNLSGKVSIGNLKVSDIRLTNFKTGIEATGSKLRLKGMSGGLYEGTFSGDILLDAAGKTLAWSANETFSGVSVAPLLKALADSDRLSGTMNMKTSLNGSGTGIDQILSSVSGNASFDFRNGSIKGVNIAQVLRDVKAKLSGKPVKQAGVQKTDFSELQGTATIRNGVVTNKDLVAKSPFMRVTGDGTINLPQSSMNYLASIKVVNTSKGQGGREFAELEGLTIPVRIKGPFSNLSYYPDVEALLKARVEQELEKEKEALEEQAKKKLQEKLGKQTESLKEDAEKSAQDKLEDELKQKLFKGLGL